jgi:hypothetical protein
MTGTATSRETRESDPVAEIEVTPEMIEAGLEEMCGYLDPAMGQDYLKEGVVTIYRPMERVR